MNLEVPLSVLFPLLPLASIACRCRCSRCVMKCQRPATCATARTWIRTLCSRCRLTTSVRKCSLVVFRGGPAVRHRLQMYPALHTMLLIVVRCPETRGKTSVILSTCSGPVLQSWTSCWKKGARASSNHNKLRTSRCIGKLTSDRRSSTTSLHVHGQHMPTDDNPTVCSGRAARSSS